MGLVGAGNTTNHYKIDEVYKSLKLEQLKKLHNLTDGEIDALTFKQARALMVYINDLRKAEFIAKGCLTAITNKYYLRD